MTRNKFFTVEADESAGDSLRVTPSQYLDELHPYQAIAEMQEYAQTLKDALQQCQQASMPIPAKIGKIGGLAFELELVAFLAQLYSSDSFVKNFYVMGQLLSNLRLRLRQTCLVDQGW